MGVLIKKVHPFSKINWADLRVEMIDNWFYKYMLKLLPNGNHAPCVILKNTPRHVSSGCLEASWECKMPTNFGTRQGIHDLRTEIKTTTWKVKNTEQIHSIIIIISCKTPKFNFPSGQRTIVLEPRVSSVLRVLPSPTGITASLSLSMTSPGEHSFLKASVSLSGWPTRGGALLRKASTARFLPLAKPSWRTRRRQAEPARRRECSPTPSGGSRAASWEQAAHGATERRAERAAGPSGACGLSPRPCPLAPRVEGRANRAAFHATSRTPGRVGRHSGFPGFSPCASLPACTGSSRRAPSFLCRSPEGR